MSNILPFPQRAPIKLILAKPSKTVTADVFTTPDGSQRVYLPAPIHPLDAPHVHVDGWSLSADEATALGFALLKAAQTIRPLVTPTD